MEGLIVVAVIGFVVWRFWRKVQAAMGSNVQHQARQLLDQTDLPADRRARLEALLGHLDARQPDQAQSSQASFDWEVQSEVELPPSSAERYTQAESHPALHGSLEDELLHQLTYSGSTSQGVLSQVESAEALAPLGRAEGASLLPAVDLSPTEPNPNQPARSGTARRIKQLLREPVSLRETLLASEVLKRPEW